MRKFIFLIIFFNLSNLVFSADYYWRGSSSSTNEWNDIQNWKIDGNGANGIPSFTDNVFFDNDSFTTTDRTVNISGISNCNNINFIAENVNQTPILTGTGSLTIYGNAIWQQGMNVSVTNIYYGDFNTNVNRTIIINNNITFTGTVTVRGSDSSNIDLSNGTAPNTESNKLNINGNLYLIGGTFNTNNLQIKTSSIYTSQNNNTYIAKALNLGNSIIKTGSLIVNDNTSYFGTNAIIYIGNESTTGSVEANSKTFGDVIFNSKGPNSQNTILGNNNIFNNVKFIEVAKIQIYTNNNQFKNLVLAPSSYVYLRPSTNETSSIINIEESFVLNTLACSTSSNLSNSDIGLISQIPITINTLNPTTEIKVNNSIINLVKVDGLSSGIASNSTFNQPNTGWIIEPGDNADFYWIGGNGSWSQTSHWSSTSGGVAGTCLPGANNNVYIDNNSSTNQQVTITIDINANLKNLEVSDGVKVNLTGYRNFSIYGSAKFATENKVNGLSIYFMNTGQNKTFDPNGLNHIDGGLFLQEEQKVTLLSDYLGFNNNQINHYNGVFDLSQNNITLQTTSYYEQTGTVKVLKLGESILKIIGSSPSFFLLGGNLTIEPGTSTIVIENTNGTTQPNSSSGIKLSTTRFYDFYNVIFNEYAIISGRKDGIDATGRNNTTFNNLTLNKSSKIDLLASIKNLTLASNTVNAISGTTNNTPAIYITQSLTGTDTNIACRSWSLLNSLYQNNPAIISLAPGAIVSINNFTVENIKLINGTGLATNSIDGGNNEGWSFTSSAEGNLYWIGGGGNWSDPNHWSFTSGINNNPNLCLPNPLTNTFFNANSGFNENSNKIILDINSFTKDITFDGSSISPILESYITGSRKHFFTLDIYGNSTMQENMTVNLTQIRYKNSNNVKTITSNGITYNVNNIYIEEDNTIGLTDNLNLSSNNNLYINRGTFNTNDNDINFNAGSFYITGLPLYNNLSSIITTNGFGSRIVNLGKSKINFDKPSVVHGIRADNAYLTSNYYTLNAEESTITFKGENVNNAQMSESYLIVKNGQKFNNVNFYVYPEINQNNLEFNEVYFYLNANISSTNNTFKKMVLASNHTYKFGNSTTQNIIDLVIRGTPCALTYITTTNSTLTTRANFNITGSYNTFNYTDIGNVIATGKTLTFEGQSIDKGNNSNIIFETPNPSYFIGFGPNWYNHIVNNNIQSTYLLSTVNFIPDAFSTYKWIKTLGVNSNPDNIINTSKDFDFRDYGYGTYKAIVQYNDFLGSFICTKDAEITITPAKSIINPNIRIKAEKR